VPGGLDPTSVQNSTAQLPRSVVSLLRRLTPGPSHASTRPSLMRYSVRAVIRPASAIDPGRVGSAGVAGRALGSVVRGSERGRATVKTATFSPWYFPTPSKRTDAGPSLAELGVGVPPAGAALS